MGFLFLMDCVFFVKSDSRNEFSKYKNFGLFGVFIYSSILLPDINWNFYFDTKCSCFGFSNTLKVATAEAAETASTNNEMSKV